MQKRPAKDDKKSTSGKKRKSKGENSRFEFKLLAGKFWVLGTLGTQKKETERIVDVQRL